MGKIVWTRFDKELDPQGREKDYRCNDCEHEFDEDEAIVHWGNTKNFNSDMDACPECDSEDLIVIKECE